MESSLGEGQDIHSGSARSSGSQHTWGTQKGTSARGVPLQRSLRKVGGHSPGAQKQPTPPPGNRCLEGDLVQITPREGEAARGSLWSKPM